MACAGVIEKLPKLLMLVRAVVHYPSIPAMGVYLADGTLSHADYHVLTVQS